MLGALLAHLAARLPRRLRLVLDPQPHIAVADLAQFRELRIPQPGTEPRLDLIEGQVSRDDGRQTAIIAMVEDLVELFLRPRGRRLRAEVIHDQEWRVTNRLEQLVVRYVTARAEGRAQVIQQVGSDNKDCRLAGREAMVCYCGGQVRLAGPEGAVNQQPPGWIFSIVACHLPGPVRGPGGGL